MKEESGIEIVRKVVALLLLGQEPREGETIEEFLKRGEKKLKMLGVDFSLEEA